MALVVWLLSHAALGAGSASSIDCSDALCRRVLHSADLLRSRHGVQKIQPPRPKISVILPIVPRAKAAEAAYSQRCASAAVRELGGLASRVHVFGLKENSEAPLAILRAAGERQIVSFQKRPKEHARLQDTAKLKRNFEDSLNKVLWRSRLVLDFVSSAKEVLELDHGAGGRHLLWLEDDVELQEGFGELLGQWLKEHGARGDWLVLRLLGFQRDSDSKTWSWGTQGWGGGGTMLCNGAHVRSFLQFAERHFDEAPLDWLPGLFPAPHPVDRWWEPKLRPVRLLHFGEHSSHQTFL